MLLFCLRAENVCNRLNVQNFNIFLLSENGFRWRVVNFLFTKEGIKIEIRLILGLKREEISFLEHLSQINSPLKPPRNTNLFSRSETAASYVINYRHVFRTEANSATKRRV